MERIAVSIIIPVYNTSKYLKKCLDSVKAQTLDNIEVIVIDDGSTDESPSICDSYKDDKRFTIIHSINQGPSESRNIGIEHSSGEYCMFVDSDDWLEPQACERMYIHAEKMSADFLIAGHVNESTKDSAERYIFEGSHFFEGEEYYNRILIHTLGLIGRDIRNPAKLDQLTPVWSRLYRTEILKSYDIKYIDLKRLPSECLQFNFEFCMKASNAAYLHEIVYHYRRNTAVSVTKPYRDNLWAKWSWWIDYQSQYLIDNHVDKRLWKAYYSRICCSVIPLGGNAVKLKSYSAIKKECVNFLKQSVYQKAFDETDYSACPLYWRAFFSSAKNQNIFIFILLTKIMRLLLRRRKS